MKCYGKVWENAELFAGILTENKVIIGAKIFEDYVYQISVVPTSQMVYSVSPILNDLFEHFN